MVLRETALAFTRRLAQASDEKARTAYLQSIPAHQRIVKLAKEYLMSITGYR